MASHGMPMNSLTAQTPVAFREDIPKSQRHSERSLSKPVLGYRAPSFSITKKRYYVGPLKFSSKRGIATIRVYFLCCMIIWDTFCKSRCINC